MHIKSSFLFGLLLLSGVSMHGFAADGMQDFSYLEANKTEAIRYVNEKFGYLQAEAKQHAQNVSPDIAKLAQVDPKTLEMFIPKEYASLVAQTKAIEADEGKKYLTVFWLFSTALPDTSITGFMAEANRLKEIYPNLQYYGVLRGFPHNNLVEYMNRFRENNGSEQMKVRMDPRLYRTLGVERVPAFAFGFCPKTYKFKSCVLQYVVRGSMTLTSALEIVSDHDERYTPIYHSFISPK